MSRKLSKAAIQLLWLICACDSGGFDPHHFQGFPPLTPVPARLAFGVQPTGGIAGTTIIPALAVTVEDRDGNQVVNASTSIMIAIGTNPTGGTLSGTDLTWQRVDTRP